jgi:tRNA nucleotidyltransferase/poly(A) polymerase
MTPREFAVQIVQRLQQAGFEAVWAGGCVRDMLLGLKPKDYDVATSALPEQIRDLFGHRQTLAIGASFGVITVLGPKSAGQVEVATFRQDAEYSDGRRPDSVHFSTAELDAQRRDFTINGMFYDPVQDVVLDFVDGRRDIDERVIRAIGNPEERIAEDKLRMLRAVRFAATYQFHLDEETAAAIRRHAVEINLVSGERIGQELRRMLGNSTRRVAAELLQETELLEQLVDHGKLLTANRANWKTRLRWLEKLKSPRFEPAVVVLLGPLLKEQGIGAVAERWKLSVAERKTIQWIDEHWLQLTRAASLPWSQIQPLLAHPDAPLALDLAEAAAGHEQIGLVVCRQRLAWPREQLDPPPLLDGNDLRGLGLKPGPEFARLLAGVRAAQLDGELGDREAALEWVRGKSGKSGN